MKWITQKALSLVLSSAVLLGMTQGIGFATAFAQAADVTDSGITVYYCDSGLYQDSNYTTPFSGDNNTVTSIRIKDGTQTIGNGAFQSCSSLTAIELPASVASIGESALAGCGKLKSITFGAGSQLQTIGPDAFGECVSLSSIELPASVTSIGVSAFNDCEALSSVTFSTGSRLQTISRYAFGGCVFLSSIELPASVTSIGKEAFVNCGALKSVALISSVSLSIGDDIFEDCSNMKNLYIIGDYAGTLPNVANTFRFTDNGNGGYKLTGYAGTKAGILVPTSLYGKSISPAVDPGSLKQAETKAYYNGTDLYKDENCTTAINEGDDFRYLITDIVFTDGVTSIGNWAFINCTGLTDITIPDSVTSIPGDDAFENCTALTSINVGNGNSSYSSRDGVLYSQDGKTLLYCPKGRTGAFTIPDGVTALGDGNDSWGAFYNCTGLTSIAIPASVSGGSESAFQGCTSLTAFNVSSSNSILSSRDGVLYTKDGTCLLYYPSGKAGAFTVPDGVKTIYSAGMADAFAGCTGLTRVAIPASVTSIGSDAFQGCTGLTCVILKGIIGENNIGEDAFDEGSGVTVTFLVPAGSVEAYKRALRVNDPNANVRPMGDSTANIVEEKDVTAISGLPAAQTVANGTAQKDLNLPSSLSVTVDGQPETVAAAWASSPEYNPDQAGIYTFTPVLPITEGYILADGVVDAVSVAVQAPAPTVSGVTVTPSTVSTQRGASQQFAAAVAGTNSPSQNVTWSVTGNNSKGTTIDQSGKLTVATDETAATLTVKAVSISDTGKYGTAIVTVTGSSGSGGSGGNSSDHRSSSSSVTPSLPSAVTDSPSGTQVVLSGATFPAGVTGISLSVTPETVNGTSTTPGTTGGTADPQGATAFHLAISTPSLNIIGTPLFYNIKLLNQNGNPITDFNGKVTVKISVPSGLRGTPHVFRYEESTGTFTDMNAVVENGFLVFSTEHFSYYTVAGTGNSITLDTKSYQMPVKGQYQIGLKLTGSKATTVKFHSTSDKTATVAKLKNGNYQVIGKGTGTAWIMFDVYDNKNHLLTHASVKVDVKTGIRPKGDSTRQIGVF